MQLPTAKMRYAEKLITGKVWIRRCRIGMRTIPWRQPAERSPVEIFTKDRSRYGEPLSVVNIPGHLAIRLVRGMTGYVKSRGT